MKINIANKINLITLLLILFNSFFNLLGAEISYEEFSKKFLKKSLILDEIFYRPKLVVSESTIFLIDKQSCRIHAFSKTNGKKLFSFCSKGEGPGEFLSIGDINFSYDKIYVCGINKLGIFSKDGKLINEQRTFAFEYTLIPFQNNYISQRFLYEGDKKNNVYFSYILLDSALKMTKIIFKGPYHSIPNKDKKKEKLVFFNECRKGIAYKNRFYTGNTELGFFIGVFDSQGNKLYDIRKDYQKIPVSDTVKQQVMNKLKHDAGESYKRFLSLQEVVFPENFPAFVNFFISNDRIYIFKYPVPGSHGRLELIFLDLKGNTIGQLFIPLGNFFRQLEMSDYVSFANGTVYFLTQQEENFTIYELDIEALFNTYNGANL